MKYGRKDLLKLALLVIVILLVASNFDSIASSFHEAEKIIRNAGPLGPIFFIALLVIGILVSPIPTSPLAIIAGMVFGPVRGFVYTLIGGTIGAVLAFLIARFFLRGWFTRNFEENALYQKIKGKKGANLAKIVFVTRLLPQVSFDMVSYLAGVTEMNVFGFAAVTFVGMIPIVFVLTFFGAFLEPYKSAILMILFIVFILYTAHIFLKMRKREDR